MKSNNRMEQTSIERATIKKGRLFLWAVIITALNPIFSGLILGGLMIAEPDLRKEGRLVLGFAVVWGAIVVVLLSRQLSGMPLFGS